MAVPTGRSIKLTPSILLAAVCAAGMGLTPTTDASFAGPTVMLDWSASGSGQSSSFLMHEHSDNDWFDSSTNAWSFQGGANKSAWGLNWVVEAANSPGALAGTLPANQFVNANLAVTNNTDSYQTFVGLVTFLLPTEFQGGTLMNGSVSASVQDVFGTGAEIRSVDDQPIYQALIDGANVQDLISSNFSLTANGGATESASDSFGIPSPVSGPVAMESISVLLTFELSPHDTANVVGSFEIAAIPAPGAMALFAGLGLFSSRRRRP